jgi:uncharacterized SAM-binding protein YcdF (DUF218 family)
MSSTGREASAQGTAARRPRWGSRAAVILLGLVVLGLGVGFVRFVALLPTTETPPARNTDGIVALTGAAFRINDALELLAAGRGRRLLITGVNPVTRSEEISRLTPEYQRWFTCCVDLDRSATNTIGNAIETRRWATDQGFQSLIVVTSNFHMPRAIVELAHQLPGVALVPYPVISERVRVESWWTNPSTARLLFWEYLKYLAATVRTAVGL